jgi:hypothetical protein
MSSACSLRLAVMPSWCAAMMSPVVVCAQAPQGAWPWRAHKCSRRAAVGHLYIGARSAAPVFLRRRLDFGGGATHIPCVCSPASSQCRRHAASCSCVCSPCTGAALVRALSTPSTPLQAGRAWRCALIMLVLPCWHPCPLCACDQEAWRRASWPSQAWQARGGLLRTPAWV